VRVAARLLALVEAAARRPSILESPRVRRVGVLLAAIVFFAGLGLALAARPELFREVDLVAWALVLACVPLTVLANSCQFWLAARLLRVPMPPVRAMLVTLLSTAANMLPLPGGSVVRIAALKSTGNTYRQGTGVTVLVAGNWLGMTLILAGCALLALDLRGMGVGALASGGLALAASGAGLRVAHNAGAAWLLALAAAQSAMVATGTLRLWLCFRALGEPAAALEAVVLTLSNVVAAAVGVAPAGLGVAEVTAAGIATAIGIPAALAFLAAALDRISGLIVVGLLTVILNVGNFVRADERSGGSSERARD